VYTYANDYEALVKFEIEEKQNIDKSSICNANLSTLVRFKTTETSNNYVYGSKMLYTK
jgi:hypothetical protein